MVKKSSHKKKEGMTIDDLALMVARGFEHTATKDELRGLRNELKNEIKTEVGSLRNEMNDRFEKVDREISTIKDDVRVIKTTVDRIEKTVLSDYGKRISILESQVMKIIKAR